MKYCECCGIEISSEARMCKRCVPHNPRNYPRTAEIMEMLEPHVLAHAATHDVIAVKPLVRRILADAPSDLCRNRPTISRLVKRILEERGYIVYDGSSKHSVWMHRVTPAAEEVRV